MEPKRVESAVTPTGDAAIFVNELPRSPAVAFVDGRNVVLRDVFESFAFHVASEVAAAAKDRRRLLVIEAESGRFSRETLVPVSGGKQ